MDTVREDFVIMDGCWGDGLHPDASGSAQIGEQMAAWLETLPKPTLRERIADWLFRLAYQVRGR